MQTGQSSIGTFTGRYRHLPVGSDGLDLAAAAERERPGVCRIGEEVMDGSEVGRSSNLANMTVALVRTSSGSVSHTPAATTDSSSSINAS
jgi:hypothetical protein